MHRKSTRALHRKPSREALIYAAIVTALSSLIGGILVSPVAQASTGAVSGSVWDDVDRDGSLDPDETGFANVPLYVLDRATGAVLAQTRTDAQGHFSVTAPDGERSLVVAGDVWATMANDWTPTTTSTWQPEIQFSLSGTATANLGLRRIQRSTTTPITTYVGPSGLTAASYNDAVPAKVIHDQVASALLGGEAARTTIRFDLDTMNHTNSSWGGTAGSYDGYSATVYATYRTWVDDGGASLTHEYGHAWSLYQAVIRQQDDQLAAYVRARGIEGDSRIGSNVFWQPREMVAEDYRQLFGSPAAASRPQANQDVPLANDVPGLKDWMRDVFTATAPSPSPSPSPTPTATASPTPTPTPSPSTTTPAPTLSPGPDLTVDSLSATPVPVVDATTISAHLSAPAEVTLVVLDSRGRLVRTLLKSSTVPSGEVTTGWNRQDDRMRRVKAGTYTVRLDAVGTDGSTVRANSSVKVV